MHDFQTVFLLKHVAFYESALRKEIAGILARYFPPLHRYPLSSITPCIVEHWFHEIGRYSKAQANKSLWILRTMFDKAKDWGLYTGENPAARVKKYPRRQRTRFVKPDEMPKLMTALAREREDVQCFFLLCLLVGCRRTEALTLRWADLDLTQGTWHKPTTKTGLPHTVPVPKSLMERLTALPRRNEYVFASTRGRHLSAACIHGYWETIRTAAGLPDVTIHDLRRTCASWLAIHGENLAVIGKGVLNHTSLAHTGIYAHLNVNPVQRALEANSVRMMGTAVCVSGTHRPHADRPGRADRWPHSGDSDSGSFTCRTQEYRRR